MVPIIDDANAISERINRLIHPGEKRLKPVSNGVLTDQWDEHMNWILNDQRKTEREEAPPKRSRRMARPDEDGPMRRRGVLEGWGSPP